MSPENPKEVIQNVLLMDSRLEPFPRRLLNLTE